MFFCIIYSVLSLIIEYSFWERYTFSFIIHLLFRYLNVFSPEQQNVEMEIYAMHGFFEGGELEPAIGVLAPHEFEGDGYAVGLVDLLHMWESRGLG